LCFHNGKGHERVDGETDLESGWIKRSYCFQGLAIDFLCDRRDFPFISKHLDSRFGHQEYPVRDHFDFEIRFVELPYGIPEDATRVITTENITCYRNGRDVYFRSGDGSTVRLDPIVQSAKGFLTKEILNNEAALFPLLFGALFENAKYQGLFSLHAAGVWNEGVGYLITGGSGCGKTSIALSLVCEGFKYVSDDVLFFREKDGQIVVQTFDRNFHVSRDWAAHFQALQRGGVLLSDPDDSKIVVDISRYFPGSHLASVRPDAIIFVSIVPNQETFLSYLGQTEGYLRLLRQISLAADPQVFRKQLKILEKLTRQTIGFELMLGQDVYEEPRRAMNFFRQVGRRVKDDQKD